MNIPSRVNPFGYDNSLPPGYFRVDFLESTNTQYIDTGVYPDNETGAQVTYQITQKTDYMPAGVFYSSSPRLAMYMLRNDADGGPVGNWGNTQIWSGNFGEAYTYVKKLTSLNFLNDRKIWIECTDFEKTTSAITLTWEQEKINFPFGLFRCASKNAGLAFSFYGRIFEAKMSQGNTLVRDFIPVLDPTGTPCMLEMTTGQPFRNNGTGQFIAGFDMDQAESLGSTIPANTTLTVSFPWEADLVLYNSRVEYSLEQARNKGCTISVQYREPEKDSPIYNKYAECKTVDDIFAVNPTQYGFRDDVTTDGTWPYPLPNLERVSTSYNGSLFGSSVYNGNTNVGTNVKKLILSLPKCTYCFGLVQINKIVEYLDIDLPICTYIRFLARQSGEKLTYCRLNAPMATTVFTVVSYTHKLKEIEVNTPKVVNAQEYFFRCNTLETVICPEGNFDNVTSAVSMYLECYVLKDFPLSYPALKTADSMFHGCRITGEQAVAILNSIPTWTDGASHLITIGIHVDYRNNEEVIAAVTAAEEKGWTVAVQWNGTPTAQAVSTFGLRKPPIYAKLRTMEHPDDTIENFLDWGHYVSSAEENGYQEFASLEEAYEHFNLEMETAE